ncbi:energy transducer TonB [Sunxiuqinia sp. A32]|uniref:energy transducer TonB n=1 Tax=Sunxiuqinia sp. A32 TaxID=3461496 RepID=UPI0040461758
MKTMYQIVFISLLVIPLFGIARGENKPNENGVYSIVEKLPEYPGGVEAIKKFISENVNFPEDAKKAKISGKVFVSFIVDEKGNIDNAKIAKGVSESLNKEALRVVNLMDGWKQGMEKGEAVKVSYTMPVNFVCK